MKISTRIRRTLTDPFVNSLIKKMWRLEDSLNTKPGSVHNSENSPKRFEILSENLALKDDHAPIPGFPQSAPFLGSSIRNIFRSIKSLEKNPVKPQTRVTEEFLLEMEAYMRSVGIDGYGYTEVPREFIFKGKSIMYDKAIVLVMEMDKKRMSKAPNFDTAVMVHQTYNRLGLSSRKLTEFLRKHGFAAHSGHPVNGLVLYPPLAQKAGLGWRGISGLLITPAFGPRVRLAAVFTNIENLPYSKNDEHRWIEKYCNSCRLCIRECPPKAIMEKPVEHANGLLTSVEDEKCFPYFANYHGCSICIRVCPFNNTDYGKLKKAFKIA